MLPPWRPWLPAALPLVMAACAGQSAGQGGPASNSAEIRAEEIASVSGATSVYDVIRIRRPRWLQPPRPTSVRSELQSAVVVYMDNVRFGGPETLREIHPGAVRLLQYLSASQAEARFGVSHPNGAIVVLTRPGS
jgi:hypothetical protein